MKTSAWGTKRAYLAQVKNLPEKALVFVPEVKGIRDMFYYPTFFTLNDPELKSKRIFARDLGKRNSELIRYFTDYNVYYIKFQNEKQK